MKKTILFLSALCMLSGCYDDYVKDFDYTAGYIMYQYDLRTFVVGEGQKFDVSVALAGTMRNDRDRVFQVVDAPELCTGDLSSFAPEEASFTALDGMTALAPFGDYAGGASSYVVDSYKNSGLTALTPLPSDYYDVDYSKMVIKEDDVNAFATVTASDKAVQDPGMFALKYGLGYKIVSADVDSIYQKKSFAVVGVRCENMFFGNWYHGGKSVIGGAEVKYRFSIPQADDLVYTLTTVNANTVKTNKYVQNKGSLILTFDGNDITITSDDVKLLPDSRRSWSNGAKLLQDRILYLNYSYVDSQDRVVEVSDSLVFRNRIRDGINEWQDTDPEHYK